MSDDFDKNDDEMSWLDDESNDDKDEGVPSEDDLEFDWDDIADDDSESGQTSQLGFTGDLSWRQDDDEDTDEETSTPPPDEERQDDEAGADWLSAADDESNLGGDPSQLGFTGMLSWRQEQGIEGEGDDQPDFSFLDETDDEDTGESVDFSFLDGIDDEEDSEATPSEATAFVDEDDEPAQPYDEFADLDDLEILRRARTGLTDEVSADDDDDLSFLDNLDDDEEGEDTAFDDDLGFPDEEEFGEDTPDWDFLSEEDHEEEPEPSGDEPATPLAGDLGFLEGIEHAKTPRTKDFLDDEEEEDYFIFGEDDSEEPSAEPSPDDEGERYFAFGEEEIDDEEVEGEPDFLASFQFDEADEEPEAPEEPEPADEDFDYAGAFLASISAEQEEPDDEEFAFEDTSGLLADESLFGDLDDEDWLTEDEDELAEPEPEAIEPGYQDLDSLLATFDEDETDLPDSDSLREDEPFAFEDEDEEDEFFEEDAEQPEDAPDRPDFLEGVMIGGTASSAAAYVRQLENKPDDELDERLFGLRSRGMNIPREQSADPDLKELLPDVSDALNEPQIRFEQENITQDVELSDDQQRGVEMLQGMVAAGAMPAPRRPADIDVDDDALLGADFVDSVSEEQPAEQKHKRPRRRGRGRVALGRALVGLLLIAAVLAPFFGFGLFGEPPPPTFDQGGGQAAVFENLGTINPRDYVLFAVEYGPTNAAELDPILEATVKHTIAEGGFPVLVGRNAVGISRAEDLMAAIAADEDFVEAIDGRDLAYNDDYYIIGFLPGGEAALRNLAESPQTVLANNSRGGETDLSLASLDRFAAVVLLAGAPDDVRLWSEQVAPQTTTPVLAGVTRVAEDIARQYLNAPDGVDGLLVSLADAVTYNQLLADQVFPDAVALQNVPTATPTLSPTPSNTPTLTPIGFAASATPPGFTPSDVPPDFTPYRVYGIGAFVVTEGGAINVRGGPSTTFDVVGTLAPGEVAIVQDERETDAGEAWTQVLLPGGEQGWVATDLLTPASENQAAAGQTQIAQVQPELVATEAPTDTEAPSDTPTATATETEPPTATNTVAVETEDPTVESMVAEATDTPAPTNTEPPTEAAPAATDTPTTPPTETEPPTATVPPTATPPPTVTPTPQLLDDGTVVRTSPRTSINVRSGPGTDFERLDVLRPNTSLLVVGNNEDGTWTEVRLPDGRDGFIFRDLLSVVPDAEPPTLAPSATPTEPSATPSPTASDTPTATPVPLDAEGLVARITSRRPVNVRTGPSRAFQPLRPLNPGQVVNVLGASEDERWLEVQLPDGRTGFMIRDAAEVLLGATYFQQATATAEVGGQADVPVAPQDLPATIPPNETEGVPPGRTQLPDGTTARVRGLENINVREQPAPLTRVIGVLPPGGEAPALVLSADERWVQVQLPDERTGWVSRSVVFVEEPEAPDTPTPANTATPLPTDAPPTAIQQEDNPAVTEEAVRSPYTFSRRMVRVQQVRARPPQQEQDNDGGTGSGLITAGGAANVRSGPGLTFSVVGTVAPAETVPVLSITDENGGWVEIRLPDGTEGYISAALIDVTEEPSDEARAPTATPAAPAFELEAGEGVGRVSTDAETDVYAGPGTSFEVVGTAAPDEELGVRGFETTDDGETWVRVRLGDDTVGYLLSDAVVVTEFPELDEPFEGEPPAAQTEAATAEATEETIEAAETAEADDVADVTEEAAALDIDGEGEGTITGEDAVTVYGGPGTDFDAVDTAAPDDTLPVRGFSTTETGETWVRVRLPDNAIGYVNADNINVTEFPEIDEPFEGGGLGSGTVTAAADVRSGPGDTFEVVGAVEAGDTLPVRGIEPNEAGETWVRVQLPDDTIGYVNTSAFEVERFPAENEPFAAAATTAEVTEDATATLAVIPALPTPTDEGATTAEATEEVAAAEATEAVTEAATEEAAEATEEAVAGANTPRIRRLGAFEVEGAGEFESSLERQEFAVRLGLIAAALIIGIGGTYNALASRSRK